MVDISREELEDICFLALRRPAMKWGVPNVGLMVNLVVAVVTGAWFGLIIGHRWMMFPWAICIGGSVHVLMMHACNRDPHLFTKRIIWLNTKAKSSLENHFGGSTLSPILTKPPRKAVDYPISLGGMWWGDG